MAWKGTELIIRIAADLKKYRDGLGQVVSDTKSAMDRSASATRGLTGAQRDLEGQASRTSEAAKRQSSSFSGLAITSSVLGQALGGLSVITASVRFVQMADAVTVLNNQLKLATGSAASASEAYADLYQVAQSSRVSFTALGGTYAQIARATQGAGISSERLLTVTQAIGNAMTISGGSAGSMQAALIQLSQGFASGTLRGEELNSVMEQTPRLAQAIAAGMGITLGELRAMGMEGELTSQAVIRALESQADVLRNEVTDATLTVGQAATVLSNAMTNVAGAFDRATGASGLFARSLSQIGQELDMMNAQMVETEKAGGGGLLQVMNALGFAVGRFSFALAGESVSQFNWVVDRLTGGVFDLNTQVDLMPDNLRPMNEQLGITGQKLQEAEAKMQRLKELDAQPMNGNYYKPAIAKAQELIDKLRTIQREQQKALGIPMGETRSGSVGSGDTALLRAQRAEWDAMAKTREGFLSAARSDVQKLNDELAKARKAFGGVVPPEVETALREKFIKPARDGAAALRAVNQEALALRRQELAVAELRNRMVGEAWREQQRLSQEAQRMAAADLAVVERGAQGAEQRLQDLQDQNAAQAMANSLYMSLEEAIERVTIARLREQQAAAMGNEAMVLALEREIQAREAAIREMARRDAASASKKARGDELRGWEKTHEQIAQSFTDALMAGGKSVAEYLKGLFRTLVLRPVLEPIARGMAGMVSGLFGGGAGSVGGIASSLLGGGGLGGLASGFGQAFSSGLGALFSGNGIGAFSNGLSLIGTGTLTNIASGLGTALGAALPAVAIIGGVVGMFSKKVKEQGFGVDLSGNMAGGAFEYTRRSNAFGSSTTRTATNDPAAMAFAMQAQAVAQASQDMAGALGLGSQALAAYTGEVRVNLKGAEDAAEVQRRMTQAMDDLQFKMLQGAEGFDMARDAFGQFMDGVRSQIEAAGISTQGISDVLLGGMMNGLGAEQTGAQLADVIVGGIYRSIAQQYTQQIAAMFMSQIVTPIFTAMAAGVPISQAISQASIDSMVRSAQQAAEALNAIFNNAEFQAAMGLIGESIADVVGSFSGIHIPDFSAGLIAHNEAAQAAERIASERAGLENELLGLLGHTTELRRRELEAIDASNRALKEQIWALEDSRSAMEDAFDALDRATAAELERIETRLSDAADLERDLNNVFSLLRDNIRDLRGEVESTALMQASAARALIAQATAGGALPDQDALRDAIDAARAGVESARYRSAAERDYARLVLANELQALQGAVQPQLSAAEQTVVELEAQRTLLEDQLKTQRDLLDAALGQSQALLSVADALAQFTNSLAAYGAVFAAAGGQKFATGAAFAGGVVTRPTRFNRDEMGEVGPEGILPLANVGGRLGVHAQTGSDPELKALVREMIRKLDDLASSSEQGAVATVRLDDRVRKLIQEDRLMVGTPKGKTIATKEAA